MSSQKKIKYTTSFIGFEFYFKFEFFYFEIFSKMSLSNPIAHKNDILVNITPVVLNATVPGTCDKRVLWAHNWNLVEILYAVIDILMIQSRRKFALVTTAQLSWHVQNWDWLDQ